MGHDSLVAHLLGARLFWALDLPECLTHLPVRSNVVKRTQARELETRKSLDSARSQDGRYSICPRQTLSHRNVLSLTRLNVCISVEMFGVQPFSGVSLN